MDSKVQTSFGEVDLPALVRAYERTKKQDERKKAWLKTDKGKEWNRTKAKEYYEKNKEKVLERCRNNYEGNRDVLIGRAKAYYAKKKAEALAESPA